jgi:adenosylhomocysteinase
LVERYKIPVYAIRAESTETYYRHINAALDHQPVITMDDGADLVSEIHKSRTDLISSMPGG